MGFTLIEMMIVVAIVLVLTTLGLPSYRGWIQNTQIYNAAESVLNGLQKAKAEAVKQNTNIEFVLGPPWTIGVAGSGVFETSTIEGTKNVTSTALAGATKITFNNLGGVGVPPGTNNTDGTAPLTQIDFTSPAGSRSLRVTIGLGGNVRMCDPALTGTASPRAC
jgi:type IV fimbrial biogenesis protein FimT